MGIRWTIGAKLWALALTAAVLIVGVGLTGLQAVGTLQAALTEVRTSGQALRSHMQGDMMHDALRSDVLAALLAAQKGQIDRRERCGRFRPCCRYWAITSSPQRRSSLSPSRTWPRPKQRYRNS